MDSYEYIEQNKNLKEKNYFIAYFDILGYEKKIRSNDKELLPYIDSIFRGFRKWLLTLDNKAGCKIRMKAFSDNILFCTEKDFITLLFLVSRIQFLLICSFDLFIRGAMLYGKLVFRKDFVFGKGLIDVYKLENEVSLFPRIIIDDSYIVRAGEMDNSGIPSDFYCIDFDNIKFVDYLEIEKNNSDIPLNDHYIRSIYDYNYQLLSHAYNIRANIDINKGNCRILQKYEWCRNYHKNFCNKYKNDIGLLTNPEISIESKHQMEKDLFLS